MTIEGVAVTEVSALVHSGPEKRLEVGAGAAQQVAAQTAADAPEAQRSSSWLADTLVSLIVILAVFSVATLCKCSRAPLANAPNPALPSGLLIKRKRNLLTTAVAARDVWTQQIRSS